MPPIPTTSVVTRIRRNFRLIRFTGGASFGRLRAGCWEGVKTRRRRPSLPTPRPRFPRSEPPRPEIPGPVANPQKIGVGL